MPFIGGHGQITSQTFSHRNHQLNDVFGTLKWEGTEKDTIIFLQLKSTWPKKKSLSSRQSALSTCEEQQNMQLKHQNGLYYTGT